MFSTTLLLALPLLAVIPHKVSAHGSVNKLVIDGKSFKGNVPGDSPEFDSVIRQVGDVEPVKGADNKALSCGHNAGPAALVAGANPGSKVEVHWVNGEQGPWVHNTGPMMTYLAKCDGDCTKFDSADAKWFKINEVGRTKAGGDWAQAALMAGKPHSFSLPDNLAAGSYLMRHELVALQLAVTKGGAEFYPSCSQLKVGGSASGAPKFSELVSLPGSYKDSDPGIFVPKVFDDTSLDYKFPGPDVASFISGSSSSSGKSSSSSGGKCSLKKKDAASAAAAKKRHVVHRPTRISRVMRRCTGSCF